MAATESLEDEFLESYVRWREACQDVRGAYEAWGKCDSLDRGFAFESCRAALDREEHAARTHINWAERLHDLER
jgi:hypothetical protein